MAVVGGPKIKLNTGAEMPALAFGTWQLQGEELKNAVTFAIREAGFRHIDCAWGYGNEAVVGEGIRAAGVPREQLFITSKLWGTWHRRVEEGLDESLRKLGLDYLDLYLMHWPIALNPNASNDLIPVRPDGKRDIALDWDIRNTWTQLEAMLAKGKVRAIGVSNMSQKKLEEFLPRISIPPAANQLELHAYNPDHALVAYLKTKGIVPQAYSPLGSSGSPLVQDATVKTIAEKHGAPPGAVLLGWLLSKEIGVVTRSANPDRIRQNIQDTTTLAQKLDGDDVATLDGLAAAGKQKRMIMPPWGIDFGFENWTNVSW
ncbi:Aldo/keto reductase [Vararia minispora EC-137]|uniref:Aldo/keto reductase n=1 Tax=Vararia minispora EC-137 TaxID=1314806 RepID=A0ACB8QY00_9AGAM|nr:Aldo/keto reductase [Vararia minispora EC-137]